ncbi:hypothetical protein C5167_037040 [Papaver somniferum]|uniref:Uncharacterized protein n=1 Tax=Papaver somniferum TaxID=3469 RepID=A0A4Y7I589_PAPSO|nr:hypothetical protein C5167_037040 [Papaver somniferum]
MIPCIIPNKGEHFDHHKKGMDRENLMIMVIYGSVARSTGELLGMLPGPAIYVYCAAGIRGICTCWNLQPVAMDELKIFSIKQDETSIIPVQAVGSATTDIVKEEHSHGHRNLCGCWIRNLSLCSTKLLFRALENFMEARQVSSYI